MLVTSRHFATVAGGLLLALTEIALAAPPLPGAIFTTTANGSRVNANIFSAKCDGQGVYLDGGPGQNAPQGAAGLPDGDYFFQVTDPSGKTLLSTDPQRYRRFTVAAGIITSRVAPQAAGDHDTGVDVDHGAITVELCPFLDTPNNGGEYKVWVTPVGDFAGNPELVDNGYQPGYFHGFVPAASKTDNFKVKARQSACLTVEKFIDTNGNGKWDAGEPLVVWPIVVRDPLGTVVQGPVYTGDGTAATTPLKVCSLPNGSYFVEEVLGEGWANTYTGVDGKKIPTFPSVSITMQGKNRSVTFGNTPWNK